MKISLIHPFTAKAIGFDDEIYLYKSHSIPQAKALKEIQEKEKFWSVKIEYFTTKLKNYSYCHEGLIKKFWISTNFKHRYKWNKEESIFQYLFYYFFGDGNSPTLPHSYRILTFYYFFNGTPIIPRH